MLSMSAKIRGSFYLYLARMAESIWLPDYDLAGRYNQVTFWSRCFPTFWLGHIERRHGWLQTLRCGPEANSVGRILHCLSMKVVLRKSQRKTQSKKTQNVHGDNPQTCSSVIPLYFTRLSYNSIWILHFRHNVCLQVGSNAYMYTYIW